MVGMKKHTHTHLQLIINPSNLSPLGCGDFELMEVPIWLAILTWSTAYRKDSIDILLTQLINYLWGSDDSNQLDSSFQNQNH